MENIPNEILQLIFSQIPFPINIKQVCKLWNSLLPYKNITFSINKEHYDKIISYNYYNYYKVNIINIYFDLRKSLSKLPQYFIKDNNPNNENKYSKIFSLQLFGGQCYSITLNKHKFRLYLPYYSTINTIMNDVIMITCKNYHKD